MQKSNNQIKKLIGEMQAKAQFYLELLCMEKHVFSSAPDCYSGAYTLPVKSLGPSTNFYVKLFATQSIHIFEKYNLGMGI